MFSCKSCDWSLNTSSILREKFSNNPTFKKFEEIVYEHCCSQVDLMNLLTIATKRLKRCLRAIRKLPEQSSECRDDIKSVKESYDELRNYLSTNNIIDPVQSAKVKSTDKPNPHYINDTFYYSSQLCDTTLKTVVLLHECEPGHHWMMKKLEKLPTSKGKPNIALIEGWGLYAERFFPSTEANEYAYLTSIIIRCCRTIVDILYNVGVWTEEQCKEFLNHYFPYKERIGEEIKRVQDNPGYNVCYLVGEHFYVELWAKFSKRFPNLKDYHNKVMECIDKAKECDFKGIEECMM